MGWRLATAMFSEVWAAKNYLKMKSGILITDFILFVHTFDSSLGLVLFTSRFLQSILDYAGLSLLFLHELLIDRPRY